MANKDTNNQKKEIIDPLRSPVALGGIHLLSERRGRTTEWGPLTHEFVVMVRERPVAYALGAAVLGFLAGYLVRRQ